MNRLVNYHVCYMAVDAILYIRLLDNDLSIYIAFHLQHLFHQESLQIDIPSKVGIRGKTGQDL